MKFESYNPTRLIFGAGELFRFGEIVGHYGKKALVVTGGGSVKKSGVFALAADGLKKAGVSIAECTGIEPTPPDQIRSPGSANRKIRRP